MTTHAVTIELGTSAYDHFRDLAEQHHRTLEEEVREAVHSLVSVDEDALPPELERELADLETMDDDALWKAAESRLSKEERDRLEALNFKQKNGGLSSTERDTQVHLLDEYQRRMLLRATAACLLKDRGHDISGLLKPVE